MSYIAKLIIKFVVAFVVFGVCMSVTNYFHPVLGAKFAVDQLNDTYTSNAGVKFWQGFKNNWIYGYIFFLVLLFLNNFKDVFTKD